MDPDALAQRLRSAALPQPERLAEYGRLLLEANRHVNLTGAKADEALFAQILDSLTLLPYVEGPMIDVGSGGGLPAIPLAIAAGVEITMVEPIAKKARFLEKTLAALDLRGVVVGERAEVAGRRLELRERFRSGTAKAVAAATTPLELVLPFIAPSGKAIFPRGRYQRGDLDALTDAAMMLGGTIEQSLSLDAGRVVLVVRKTGLTPQRFPRRTGIPEKRPLCVSRGT